MRVLAVEDEPSLSALLESNLGRNGFVVDCAATIAAAWEFLRVQRYDAILLDLQLPDGDGLELLTEIRARKDNIAIIALTARDLVPDRISGLNGGCDDYIIKPFALDELIARIRAVLRRPGAALGLMLKTADIEFNSATRNVVIGGKPVALPRRELAILESLLRCAGRVVTRNWMLDTLYGFEEFPTSNALDANVSRLRRRLKEAGSLATLRVIRGVGYMLEADR